MIINRRTLEILRGSKNPPLKFAPTRNKCLEELISCQSITQFADPGLMPAATSPRTTAMCRRNP